ncbi:hypothetical protein NP233_g1366 [Leucocoprinus birnbaumii]|uniref:Uncharacterized protein n=1 Tax=Leucocoprinus birnbaumii TaxID=56174 RepID=A0AAD5YZP5_9AGAR|nr:hypothetical protein NP233_g1366 [Leucocoprinus birnbaumii]
MNVSRGTHDTDMKKDGDNMDYWRIILLGDCVGKTALIERDWNPTIEEIYQKELMVDSCASFIEIIDTSGAEEYTSFREQWSRKAQGFIFVYSITSRNSFEQVPEYYRSMRRVIGDVDVPFILVGNKSDLKYDRQVSWNEGAALSDHLGCVFFEASAKSGENIDLIFFNLIRGLRGSALVIPEKARIHRENARVMRLQNEIDYIYSELRKTAYGQTVQAMFHKASNEQSQILEPLLAQADSEDLKPEEKEKLEEMIREEYILCLREFRGYFAEVKAMGIKVGPYIREFYGLPEPTKRKRFRFF